MPLLWLGPWHGHPLLTLFSQDGFLLFWFSAPTSAGMNVLGGVGPGLSPLPPQNPKCTPTSSPFMGTPPPPHIVVQRFLKKKEKKSRKKKTLPPFPGVKETVYLKAYWLLGLCCHWILPPGSSSCPQPPISPPERRPEAKSPRVGLLGPTEIKMELVKENVKKKKKKSQK